MYRNYDRKMQLRLLSTSMRLTVGVFNYQNIQYYLQSAQFVIYNFVHDNGNTHNRVLITVMRASKLNNANFVIVFSTGFCKISIV
jgi:hypothetical protein